MYLKTHVCSAFVSYNSRSDSSALLDKVGLTALWGWRRDAALSSFSRSSSMVPWHTALQHLQTSHRVLLSWHSWHFLYSNLLWLVESGRLLLIQARVVCGEWSLIGTMTCTCLCVRHERKLGFFPCVSLLRADRKGGDWQCAWQSPSFYLTFYESLLGSL